MGSEVTEEPPERWEPPKPLCLQMCPSKPIENDAALVFPKYLFSLSHFPSPQKLMKVLLCLVNKISIPLSGS